jgi:hypothetical protein
MLRQKVVRPHCPPLEHALRAPPHLVQLDSSPANLPCFDEFVGLVRCTSGGQCVRQFEAFVACLNKNNVLGGRVSVQPTEGGGSPR